MDIFPIAKDGWRFVLPLLAAGTVLLFFPHPVFRIVAVCSLFLALICAFFFRDFDRNVIADPRVMYSPADGKILEVADYAPGIDGRPAKIIRIFLSVLNVHVQRSPLDGRVEKVEEKRGRFWDARHPKAHLENAQNTLTLSSAGGKVVVTQIAGFIARRIVCRVRAGETLRQGERYGLIRFGSQVDLVVPCSAEVVVKPGDQVRGGLTVIAKWMPK